MATLVDTYTPLAVVETDLKAYLGITGTAEDPFLEGWLSAACLCGDSYIGQDFTDATGADITHPPAIRQGVFEWIRVARSFKQAAIAPGLTSVKTKDLAQGFAGAVTAKSGVDIGEAAKMAAAPFWHTSRVCVWR